MHGTRGFIGAGALVLALVFMRTATGGFVSWAAAVQPAAAAALQETPGARRRQPRHKPRTRPATARRAAAPRIRLRQGRWAPEIKDGLEALIMELGRASTSYSAWSPPVAVFIWDNVAAVHHAGEAVFHRLVDKAQFKFGPVFWDALPPARRQRARTGYEGFRELAPAAWKDDPYYQMYRKAMFMSYSDLCREDGLRACRRWLVSLLRGFDEAEIADYTTEVIEEELERPISEETITESVQDERPIKIARGLAVIPEMQALVTALLDQGFDVWALSSSDFWSAQAFAARYGIHHSRVVGVRSRVFNRVLQAEVLDPVPEGIGLAEALTLFLGRGPELAVGGGKQSRPFFDYGARRSLVMDSGDAAFREYAGQRGWWVQPSFVPDTGIGSPGRP